MFLTAATVVFVAIHPNAGVHFNALGKSLKEESIAFVAYGADQAFPRMEELCPINISETVPLPHLEDSQLKSKAESLAERISKEASVVLIDVGAPFSLHLTKALKNRSVKVIAYVDNPDRAVPGYSLLAQKIEEAAGDVLYASAELSETRGIGFYPLEDDSSLRLLREDQEKRSSFLKTHQLLNEKPLLVFMGGANIAYVEALRSFIKLNKSCLQGWNLLLHRHPRAKEEGLEDATLWETIGGKISQGTQNEAIAFANAIVYYQTTTALKGVLLGVPTLEWGGFEDGLVKKSAVQSAITKEGLSRFLKDLPPPNPEAGLQGVGYRKDWKSRWIKIICRML